MILNPAYSIPSIYEKRLKSAMYTSNIYDMIDCGITRESMSRTRLRLFEQHDQLIEEHEDPEKLPTISRTLGIVK